MGVAEARARHLAIAGDALLTLDVALERLVSKLQTMPVVTPEHIASEVSARVREATTGLDERLVMAMLGHAVALQIERRLAVDRAGAGGGLKAVVDEMSAAASDRSRVEGPRE